ncbi:MAG: PfkB family carbohydrate kinase [Deltaproteobacteria bacterium]|jgi:sugar/nucleoside kinase (ribokinase family)
MSSMLVVGSVAQDTIHNHLGTHPYVLGGSATFASLAGRLFAPTKLVGVVGEDFPATSVQLLKDKGIDTSGLEVAGGKTFHWEGRYSDDLTSRESIKTELNVFADFHPKIPAAHRATPYVMLGNIHPDLQVEVLDQVERPKLVIADTMNFWITGTPDRLARMLSRIDLLVINEEEARLLAGVHNIAKAAKALTAMGPRIVVIKRGEYGALLFENDTVFSAPAYPIEDVVDPTGAGDTFAGGMLGLLTAEDRVDAATLRRAVIFGSVVASYCVEGISVSRLTSVTMSEVKSRYAAFARLAHFASESELAQLR